MSEANTREALLERLFQSTIGALELFHVYIGERIGLYGALGSGGPMTPRDLAAAAQINERYAREWLEEQAVAGILSADEGSAEGRRFSLPAAHAEVLNDPDSVYFGSPFALGVVGVGAVMEKVLDAFRTGNGIAYEAYGRDVRDSISLGNRPGFINSLGTAWFPAIPDVDQRLRTAPPARIADVGCGTGWSAIGIALAYPKVTVDGFDVDAASIEEARRNAAGSGVADRVKFEVRDASDPELAGSYDLVTAFETIHDMTNPVGALRAMRGLVKDGGVVLVADEKVAEEFTAPGDDVERYLYGWSAVHCLPVGMGAGSAATGTVMRPKTLRKYAREAGFADVEVLPVEADIWRFYRLVDVVDHTDA